jgi:protein-disulfide isomerase
MTDEIESVAPGELPPSETGLPTPEPEQPEQNEQGERSERSQLTAWMQSKPVLAVMMLVVGLMLGYYGRPMIEQATATPVPVAAVPAPQPLPQQQSELMPYLIKQTRHFRGSPEAPITLIEFADYQCPFCGLHHTTTEPQIEQAYITTGQVRVGYMHFAFLGEESVWAAAASECAADQSKFWEYHDVLFNSQNGENRGAFTKDNLKGFAANLGLNTKSFNECLDSGKYESFVLSQTQALQSLGVQSTPTFVLNGQPLVGAQEFSAFQQIVEPLIGN